MQGKQHYQPTLFSRGDLERYIPQNHRLRKIDKVLDLSYVRELTREYYSKWEGRPSIDPEVFFRMLIISYLYGMASDRQLCEEIHVNLAFRWFLRLSLDDNVPDHSSLTKIRDRLGERVFQDVFEQMVKQCQKAGFIQGKRMMADASLIEANASIDSLVEKEDSQGTPKEKSYNSYLKRYGTYAYRKKEPAYSNQTHQSATDSDSKMVGRVGCFKKLFYKTHYLADADNRIITDCFVTDGAQQEGPLLISRLEGQRKKFNFPLEEVIADSGYGGGKNYHYFDERNIESFIPVQTHRGGQGGILKSEFIYNRENDYYICPQEEKLYPTGQVDKKRGYIFYKIKNNACINCPIKSECVPNGTIRSVIRTEFEDENEKVKARMQTLYFKEKLRERMWKMEGLFAEAKVWHGLRRAKYRGRAKVQIQAYMTAFVQNLKRLAQQEFSPRFCHIFSEFKTQILRIIKIFVYEMA